jgi:8-oxo-dGTP pyrophosphatase MutT (NUDIX family)
MMQSAQHLPLHVLADELRAIATETLVWRSKDPYNVQRCTRLIRIAAEIAAIEDRREADEIEKVYQADLAHLTPYCGGDAAIFDEKGRLLLIQRWDDGRWAMPGGLFEVGETPAEGTCREAREETGLEVEAVKLSGVYDSRLCGTRSAYHLYQFVFVCRLCSQDDRPRVSNETLAVQWYAPDILPELSSGHATRIADAVERRSGARAEAVFDRGPQSSRVGHRMDGDF